MKRNLVTEKCKERDNSNSGNAGLADFLSEKDSRLLHRQGNRSRKQKMLHMNKRPLELLEV